MRNVFFLCVLIDSNDARLTLYRQNYRELDRGTNYFRSHILSLWDKYNKDGPVGYDTWIELVLWASLCYRLVNRISTFEEFGCIPEVADWPRFKRFMNKAVRSGTKVFTDAHITGGLKPFLRNMEMVHEKDAQLVKEVSEQVLESVHKGSLEGCFDAVKTINGAGNFTAWQVVCDLMESQCLSPCTEDDWTELGPGAKGELHRTSIALILIVSFLSLCGSLSSFHLPSLRRH